MRNAYAEKVGFIADLAYKTRRLIEDNAEQQGLGRLTKSVTFDVATLESLRKQDGRTKARSSTSSAGFRARLTRVPRPHRSCSRSKDRADRILKDLEERKINGLAAMDLLAALAAEKEAAMRAAKASGLSARAFAVAWLLRDDPSIKSAKVDADGLAREAESLLERFPNAAVNADEQRRLRAAMYKPLLSLSADERARVVDAIVRILLADEAE